MLSQLYDTPYLRQAWSGSKTYRRVLIAVIIFAALRLLVHTGSALTEDYYPDDLRIYLDAARDLQHERDLYPPLPLEHMEFYQYAPSFAVTMLPSLWIGKYAAAMVHTVFHLVIYFLLYAWWDRIFRQVSLERGRQLLAWTLPIWLVFTGFWNDMYFLNVYILTALLATLLIDAVLNERLGWSLVWLSVILQIKPQWAFAAAIPLLLGNWRFFLKLIVLAVIVYVLVIGVTVLVAGPEYGWEQHKDYAHLLTGIGNNYPWRGPDKPYLGYNHSIPQIIVFVFGIKDSVLNAALVIRVLLLIPLAVFGVRCLLRVRKQAGGLPPSPAGGGRVGDGGLGRDLPLFSLDLFFALYTAVFIWLEVVWELSLGIALFVYLLATTENRNTRRLIWIVFLPYALLDAWQTLSYVAGGDAVLDNESYVLTDPSIYLPIIMIVTVVFHGLLVWRLWRGYRA